MDKQKIFNENGELTIIGRQYVFKPMNNVIILNNYLSEEIQEDVLKDKPLLQHSEALQKVIDTYAEKGKTLVLYGNFNVDKLTGYLPEYYGTDGRKVGKSPELTLNGSQPCLKLDLDNNTVDFSGATFYVQRLFNDGLHIRQFKGNNKILNAGKWITQRIYDIDPNVEASEDRNILQKTPNKTWLAPIDRDTGFAFKGYNKAGFNTTTYKTELSNYRSNAIDTSVIGAESGDGYSHNYPQDDGTTASTWGSWGKGFIGNFNAGMLITQNPNWSKSIRNTATLEVSGGYFRGFTYAGVQVGTLGKPDGSAIANKTDENDKYTVKNVILRNLVIEDNYESGIQRSRFDNLTIENCVIRRSGHPNWSLNHSKPDKPNVSQVDPGYGIASGRKNVQGKLVINNCVITDCNRKGIDAHHGNSTIITNNYIKAGYWGIQVALEEPQVDKNEPSWEHEICKYIIENNEIHASVRGIDFANGAFGNLPRIKKNLWYMKLSVKVKSNHIYAPVGWYYNYSHDGFTIEDNTFVYSAPYGFPKLGGNETSKSYAIFHGSQDLATRGVGFGDKIIGNRIMNSPYGNFSYGVYLQNCACFYFSNNHIDITPYKKRTFELEHQTFISNRDEVFNDGITTQLYVTEGLKIMLLSIFTNNFIINRKDSIESLETNNIRGTFGTLETHNKQTLEKFAWESDKENYKSILVKDIDISSIKNPKEKDTELTYYFKKEDAKAEGVNPPDNFEHIFITKNEDLGFISRLGGERVSNGVYTKLTLPEDKGSNRTELNFKLNIHKLGLNKLGTVICVDGVPALSIKDVEGKLELTSHVGGTLSVNGNLLLQNKLEYDTEYDCAFRYVPIGSAKTILLGSPENGNNQISADFIKVLVRNPTRIDLDMPPEEENL